MADPNCSNAATLILDNPCLASENLTAHQRKSLKIWFLANQLSVIGGTDYTSLLASTLLTDANTYAQNLNESQKVTADLAIHRNNAVEAGATISTDFAALMVSIAPLSKANDDTLDEMLLLLMCKLGRSKTYPQ